MNQDDYSEIPDLDDDFDFDLNDGPEVKDVSPPNYGLPVFLDDILEENEELDPDPVAN